MKLKVTNTSQLSKDGKRSVFLTEAGELIKPGEYCLCNRLDDGSLRLVAAKVLKVEEGDFEKEPLFKDEKKQAVKVETKTEEPVKVETKTEEPVKVDKSLQDKEKSNKGRSGKNKNANKD